MSATLSGQVHKIGRCDKGSLRLAIFIIVHGSVYKSDAMTAGIPHTLVSSPILCNVAQVCASLLIPLHRHLSDTDNTITEKLLLQLESLQKNFTIFKLFFPPCFDFLYPYSSVFQVYYQD